MEVPHTLDGGGDMPFLIAGILHSFPQLWYPCLPGHSGMNEMIYVDCLDATTIISAKQGERQPGLNLHVAET